MKSLVTQCISKKKMCIDALCNLFEYPAVDKNILEHLANLKVCILMPPMIHIHIEFYNAQETCGRLLWAQQLAEEVSPSNVLPVFLSSATGFPVNVRQIYFANRPQTWGWALDFEGASSSFSVFQQIPHSNNVYFNDQFNNIPWNLHRCSWGHF